MHNNIMAASSKDRPPMLGPGRYSLFIKFKDPFLIDEYMDTGPIHDVVQLSLKAWDIITKAGYIAADRNDADNPTIFDERVNGMSTNDLLMIMYLLQDISLILEQILNPIHKGRLTIKMIQCYESHVLLPA
ncbi:hypothetical protein Tco_1363445 [Tanacetum coccineum]